MMQAKHAKERALKNRIIHLDNKIAAAIDSGKTNILLMSDESYPSSFIGELEALGYKVTNTSGPHTYTVEIDWSETK